MAFKKYLFLLLGCAGIALASDSVTLDSMFRLVQGEWKSTYPLPA